MKLEPLCFELRIHPEKIVQALRYALPRLHGVDSVSYTELFTAEVREEDLPYAQPCIGGKITVSIKGREYILDRNALQRGVQGLADHRGSLLGRILDGDLQLGAREVFLQYALFGEVRYE
jgi:hypothetical protein